MGIPAKDVFFTSDTHFGHANIIKYANRPFNNIEEHDQALVDNWNAVVPEKGAQVFHLGDFLFKASLRHLMDQLNGQIHLIQGNHDKRLFKGGGRDLFASLSPYKEVKVQPPDEDAQPQMIVLCHYAFEVWNKSHYGSWHLHGHSHGTLPTGNGKCRVDAGVDVWDYKPITFEQLQKHMSHKEFVPIDHHKERK
jgi:calcineurin-like phosphoesterase family protein